MFHVERAKKLAKVVLDHRYIDQVATLADMALASCQGIVHLNKDGMPNRLDTLTAKLYVQALRIQRLTRHKKGTHNVERRKHEQYHFDFINRRV